MGHDHSEHQDHGSQHGQSALPSMGTLAMICGAAAILLIAAFIVLAK